MNTVISELTVTYFDNQWGMLFAKRVGVEDDMAWMGLGLANSQKLCKDQLVNDPMVLSEAQQHDLDLNVKDD